MSTTDTEIKATLEKSDESQRFTLHYPLAAFFEIVLTAEQRQLFLRKGYKPDVYLDNRHGDGDDDVLVIHFSHSKEFAKDATGLLVETPSQPLNRCASKSEVERLEAKIDEVAARTVLSMPIGGT